MASPFWMRTLINKTFSQRFLFSKMTRYPVVGRIVEYLLFDGDDILYLPRDRVIPVNEGIDPESIDTMPVPSMVLEHFVRSAGFIWKMDFCICRESNGCRDYPVDLGCLFIGEAARDISPGFGHQVGVEEALEHAARAREAGLVHMIGRNKLDSVWLNVGPPQKLLTICNCCPCCCLWGILPTINPRISSKIKRMPGISFHVTDACVGCGTCVPDVCFVHAIHIVDRQAVIDQETCRGCGRCAEACPNHAIEISITSPSWR